MFQIWRYVLLKPNEIDLCLWFNMMLLISCIIIGPKHIEDSSFGNIPGVSSFPFWVFGSLLFIKFSLDCKKAWSLKSPSGSNFIFLCLEDRAVLPLAVVLKHLCKTWKRLLFIFERIKEKQHMVSKMFMEEKVYLVNDIKGFA